MNHWHPLLCSFAGFAALCLSMDRHHEAALAHEPSLRRQQALRAVGALAFVVSIWTVLGRPDIGIAWTAWTVQLSLAAVMVVTAITWRPRWLPPAGVAAGVVGVLTAPLWR